MKNVVQFSGGKDSTAMLLLLLERGVTVDEIILSGTLAGTFTVGCQSTVYFFKKV